MKILIVEDNEDARLILKKTLEFNGHQVEEASDGSDALEKARKRKPDMIVSDILMPVMDGFVLCREVRQDEALRDVPFVFYTATYTDYEDEKLALELGADRFLRKPLDGPQFLSALKGVVREVAKGEVAPSAPGMENEEVFLKMYNERLIQKLEKKMEDLEQETIARRQSEQLLKATLAAVPDMIFRLDREGRFLDFKPANTLDPYVTPDQFLGKTAVEVMPGELACKMEECIARALHENTMVSLEYQFSHGEELRDYEARCVPCGQDQVVATVRDITDLKLTELALKNSEEKYRTLAEHARDAIFIAQDGVMKFPNPATTRLTGYSAKELAGMPFAGLIHPEDRNDIVEDYTRSLKGEMISTTHDFRIINKKGDALWVQMSSTRVNWEGRLATLNFVRDMTAHRKLEEQYVQAQKMESIGRLAGGVAHDFNNLLSVIIGNAEISLEMIDDHAVYKDYIREILKAAFSSASVTRQLLAFSRKQIIQPVTVNLNDIVNRMEKMLGRLIGEDVEMTLSLADDLGLVNADPGQIEQVLMNFIANARDAMPKGGKLTIETANVALDNAYFMDKGLEPASGPYIMLAVSDTGIGMDRETCSLIFEPFFTTKEKGTGTGLGLATVYGIVKQAGGYVWVYSEPGRGATFKVYLPRLAHVDMAAETEKVPDKPVRGVEMILVAEDDDSLRKLIRDSLERYGFRVLAVRNGKEAIEIMGKHAKDVGLLITDVVMPEMGGDELARIIRKTYPKLKILFISGYPDETIARHGVIEAGVNFIQKPFSPKVLAGKVRSLLDATDVRT